MCAVMPAPKMLRVLASFALALYEARSIPERREMSGQRAIRGKIVVVASGKERPLVGASVTVPKLQLSARTDAMGVFCFPGVPVGTNQEGLRVVVTAKGQEHEVSLTAVRAAQDGEALLIRFPEKEV